MASDGRISGDRNPLIDVQPAFNFSQAIPSHFETKVGVMDFMSNGDLILSTWDPDGAVYRLSNMQNPDPEKIKV